MTCCSSGNSMCSFWVMPLKETVVFLFFHSFVFCRANMMTNTRTNIGATSWKDTDYSQVDILILDFLFSGFFL